MYNILRFSVYCKIIMRLDRASFTFFFYSLRIKKYLRIYSFVLDRFMSWTLTKATILGYCANINTFVVILILILTNEKMIGYLFWASVRIQRVLFIHVRNYQVLRTFTFLLNERETTSTKLILKWLDFLKLIHFTVWAFLFMSIILSANFSFFLFIWPNV